MNKLVIAIQISESLSALRSAMNACQDTFESKMGSEMSSELRTFLQEMIGFFKVADGGLEKVQKLFLEFSKD